MASFVGLRFRPTVGKDLRRWALYRSVLHSTVAFLGLLMLTAVGVASAESGTESVSPASATRIGTAAAGPDAVSRRHAAVAPSTPEFDRPALGKGVFLVASPELRDPNFFRTVVLLVEYNSNGAMGLVINRPTDVALASVLPDLDEVQDRLDRVYFGGPVARNTILLLIQSRARPRESSHVFEDIYVSMSESALREVLQRNGPAEGFQAYAGYAGWAPGQLEGELERGDWHLLRAEAETVFSGDPSGVWQDLIRQASGVWVRRGATPSALTWPGECSDAPESCALAPALWGSSVVAAERAHTVSLESDRILHVHF